MSTDDALFVDVRHSVPDGFSLELAFQAPPGVTVLFGPSGSGKSTTLASIAGILKPQAGRIALGADVWFDSATKRVLPIHRRGVSLLFQSLALFPHMTARQNVAYGIDRSVPRDERQRLAEDMLVRVRVAHLSSRRPRTFSGGEAQRVALARALARRPRVLLLDEPFSALDEELREELCADVRLIVAEIRIPTILVTHQISEATLLGDWLIRLQAGRIVETGPISQLQRRSSSPPLAAATLPDA